VLRCHRSTTYRNPEKDKGLQELFSSDAEMQSPYITFDFLSKRFEAWDSSRDVLMYLTR
jgi:hypothetical protein